MYSGETVDHRWTENPLLDIALFWEETLITQKSKKQNVVARSSAEAKYRALAHKSCELMWINLLLQELKFVVKVPMTMHCDNQATIHIASTPVLLE